MKWICAAHADLRVSFSYVTLTRHDPDTTLTQNGATRHSGRAVRYRITFYSSFNAHSSPENRAYTARSAPHPPPARNARCPAYVFPRLAHPARKPGRPAQ